MSCFRAKQQASRPTGLIGNDLTRYFLSIYSGLCKLDIYSIILPGSVLNSPKIYHIYPNHKDNYGHVPTYYQIQRSYFDLYNVYPKLSRQAKRIQETSLSSACTLHLNAP